MLPTGRLNTAHRYALASISDSPTLRAALGSVLYLLLSALPSLSVATAIRDTAVSAVLGLLHLPSSSPTPPPTRCDDTCSRSPP